MSTSVEDLIALSRELGREDRHLAILGEGNTSCRTGETFWVKASGTSLSNMTAEGVTECRIAPLLELLNRDDASDDQINAELTKNQVTAAAKRPSTEAVFHAYLLSLPGISWVGHTHPIAVNGILCSPRAAEFAASRTFPDEIVCCGSASLLLPYVDPGLALAKAIRAGVEDFQSRQGKIPKIILLANHGLIATGSSPAGVLAATRMAAKAAEIFTRAATMGGPIFLTPSDVDRIENRSDEHYRRKQLGV
jgi:rhamnose utilization protein RhaD (predicted bifunctional aldolase and dehydrogenase)